MKLLKRLFYLSILIFGNTCIAQTASKPLVVGNADILHSKILNEDRIVNVYLPEGYQQNDGAEYPVIYVLDGGVEEDFLHIMGIVRFNTQPWIARFPRSIVVGIEGNVRRRDFTFAVNDTDFIEKEGFQKSSFPQWGGSARYIDFLEKELQPYIEKKYGGSGRKTVIGESLSGLLTTEILLKRPHVFQDYIIISPSLWWGERSLLEDAKQLLDSNLRKTVNVYVGASNKEEDKKMFDDAEALYHLLESNENITSNFDYIPDELHSTIIHQAVYNAFKKFYPKLP